MSDASTAGKKLNAVVHMYLEVRSPVAMGDVEIPSTDPVVSAREIAKKAWNSIDPYQIAKSPANEYAEEVHCIKVDLYDGGELVTSHDFEGADLDTLFEEMNNDPGNSSPGA